MISKLVRTSSSGPTVETPDAGSALLDRFDRIPVWPYPRSVLWLIGAGYFFSFFDVLTIGVALPKIAEHFHLSTGTAAVSITASLIGYVVGALVIGTLADRFGRRTGLYLSLGCFTVGSLLSAFSPGMVFLDASRFLTGIGIGAEIAVVSTYLGELSPSGLRGRMAAKAGLFAMSAQIVVPLLARLLLPSFDTGWRILFLVGALGGVVTLVLRLRFDLPITLPRMIATGELARAQSALDEAERRAEQQTGRPLPPPAPSVRPAEARRSTVAALFSAPYLRRVVLLVSVWFVFYLGDYAWLTLGTTLFVGKGFGLGQTLEFMTVASFGFVVGAFVGTRVNDRLERKSTAAIALTVWAATMAGIGLFPVAPVIMVLGLVSNTALGLFLFLMYAYTTENFPTSCRSTGVALTDGLGHAGGALAPVLVLVAQAAGGFTGAFLAMAVTGVLAALLVLTGIRMRPTAAQPH